MIAKTYTCSLLGIDAILVEVEVDLASGFPGFAMVGLPDNLLEGKQRQGQSGDPELLLPLPFRADHRKPGAGGHEEEGAGFDLPIAVGILAALGIVKAEKAAKMIFAESLLSTAG